MVQIDNITNLIKNLAQCRLFRAVQVADELLDCEFEALPDHKTIPRLQYEYVMVAALPAREDGMSRYYMDLWIPERVNDYTLVLRPSGIAVVPTHEVDTELVPALASEDFGVYELYYSRERPELGVAVLEGGLVHASRKAAVAEDLGYIYRDEGRELDAIRAFSISLDEGPSDRLSILLERSDLWRRVGDEGRAAADIVAAIPILTEAIGRYGNRSLMLQRAELRERLGDLAGAMADREAATRMS